MQKYDLNTLMEYDEKRFCPKVLMNEPGYRMVLMSIRAGQHISEQATPWIVTVQAIHGHVTLFADALPCELYAGQVACIENGVPHGIEARDDSALLVLYTVGSAGSDSEDLDLREIARPERHSRVLETFDALPVGRSLTLAHDHDSIPLNRQMEKSAAGTGRLGIIERGQDAFRVRIRRFAPHV